MAGTLVITTLSDGTNSTSATNCIQGSAKAWVNFNGSGGAIRASYNVSSITVNGTGDYTVNFTNAMPDGNYGVAGIGHRVAATYARNIQVTGTPTASAVSVVTDGSIGLFDSTFVYVAIFR
jgi:hypothetical protein